MAVAHSNLVTAYYMISRKEPYHEAGADYFDKRRPEEVFRRLVKRLQTPGYDVALSKPVASATAQSLGYFHVHINWGSTSIRLLTKQIVSSTMI